MKCSIAASSISKQSPHHVAGSERIMIAPMLKNKMNDIAFTLIETTEDLNKYRKQLVTFFGSLSTEKRYFTNLNMDYVKNSDFILIASDEDRIVGVAGVETTHLIAHKAYVGVKKEYQTGLGAFLSLKRNHEARRRYPFIILKINPDNVASQKMNRALGYRELGRRYSDDYLIMPFSPLGLCLFYAFKIALPAVNLFDKFVTNSSR